MSPGTDPGDYDYWPGSGGAYALAVKQDPNTMYGEYYTVQ